MEISYSRRNHIKACACYCVIVSIIDQCNISQIRTHHRKENVILVKFPCCSTWSFIYTNFLRIVYDVQFVIHCIYVNISKIGDGLC